MVKGYDLQSALMPVPAAAEPVLAAIKAIRPVTAREFPVIAEGKNTTAFRGC
ncbi:MAG: hypothetical protein ACJASV_003180 [Pseudorhodobacter sp.]